MSSYAAVAGDSLNNKDMSGSNLDATEKIDKKVVSTVPEEEEEETDAKKRPHRKNFFQWVPTDDDQLAKSEKRMLKSISHLIKQSTVAGLNTIQTTNPDHSRHLLLVHGFAGGVANWLPNWKSIVPHTNVYAIDLPGFARSHRPDVKFHSAEDAIVFITDSILMWLKEMKLDKTKVDLCGHSFGGYITAHFAIKYPGMVDRLILTDPWGCPKKFDRKMPLKFRFVLWTLRLGNPLSVLRGPWGPKLLPSARKDFADRWAPHIEDTNDFYDYTFHCNAASPPIGEQAFQACCTGQGFSEDPLELSVPEGLDPSIYLGVIFGEKTWMDTKAGDRMLEGVLAKEGARGHKGIRFVPDAGHQVMSDNARDFNNILLELLDHHTLM